jgi:hypothetical protein
VYTIGLLAVLLLAMIPAIGPRGHASAPAYLSRQTAALRAPYRHQVQALSDATYYRIEASLDLQNATVAGTVNLRYTNTADRSLSELVFRLLPNAQTIYGGGNLSVESVTQGSHKLRFAVSPDHTVMRVHLPRRLAPGDTAALDISFASEIPINTGRGYGILNQTSQITSLAGWYPILVPYRDGWQTPEIPRVGDALLAETSLYEVSLTVPKSARVVSTGRVTRVDSDGSRSVWHMVSGPAREFAVVISEDLERHQTQVDGVLIRFHSLHQPAARTSPEAALDMIAAAFQAYVDHFGPYPFTEFDVVEAPIPIGGYEFPGMVFVDEGLRSRGSTNDYRYIVAHEVAHQWWYGLVGSDSVHEPWLDEAFASYSAAIYLEQAAGEAAGRALVDYWRHEYGRRRDGGPPVNSPALAFSSWRAYRSPTYYQGALFLDALREELGDARFFLLLRRYLDAYRYRSATTEDFLRLAEEVSCRDLDPLLAQWFEVEDGATSVGCTPRSAPVSQ